ncbi:MAG: hypothetical protein IJ390_02205 [Lachnospiraceae bacterium]|nr:hypothetical protein [Lachnospiraceae bacterium]
MDIYISNARDKFAQADKRIAERKYPEALELFSEIREVMDHAYFESKAIQYQLLACEAIKGSAILKMRLGKTEEALAEIEKTFERLNQVSNEDNLKEVAFYYAEMHLHRCEIYAQLAAKAGLGEKADAHLDAAAADGEKAIEYAVLTEGYEGKFGSLHVLQGSHHQLGSIYTLQKKSEKAAEHFKESLTYCEKMIQMKPNPKLESLMAGNCLRLALAYAQCKDVDNREDIVKYANQGLAKYSELYNKNKTAENVYNLGVACYNMTLIAEIFTDYKAAKSYCDKAIAYQTKICETDKYMVQSVYRLLAYFDTCLRVMDKGSCSGEEIAKYKKDMGALNEIYKKRTGRDFKQSN